MNERAADVRFNESDGRIERERRDRTSGIRADARQCHENIRVARKFTAIFPHNLLRDAFQIERATVIANAGPCRQHIADRCSCERAEIWEMADEFMILRHDARYLRLLKHNLGNENAIRVT